MLLRCIFSARRLAGLAALAILWGIVLGNGPARGAAYTPYQHRAWYIYLIAQYTSWPKDAFGNEQSPLVLGILGKDPFGKEIDVIRDKPLHNRKIEIRYYPSGAKVPDCHLLFICESEKERLSEIISQLGETPVLTFSEIDGFVEQAGMVKLWVKPETKRQGYLYFEINLAAASKANLRISSQVLKLAKPEPKPR